MYGLYAPVGSGSALQWIILKYLFVFIKTLSACNVKFCLFAELELESLAHTHLLTDLIFRQIVWGWDWGGWPREQDGSCDLLWIRECWSDSAAESEAGGRRETV